MAAKQTKRTSLSRSRPGRVDVVTFDLRRNLINVLGEEHYPYAEYLYHELAANAYDEDATEVQIVEEVIQAPGPGRPALHNITIRDNGNGMNLELLKEYFMVGESGKPERRVSERFKRPLIGRIGVGKVSILKVARQWTITTERHRGLDAPVRLTVHVDVDEWIEDRTPAFVVQSLEPEGRPGTTIVLEGVHAKLREDRIQRHLQRLPLGDEFKVWRNGDMIPPKHWHGVNKLDIDAKVVWTESHETRRERIRGEIWIRPVPVNKREQAYISEPATEQDALKRDAAGIEVRVNGDVITREFFGHDSHGHGVNRIWGWVDADWLPILGNRTDYLRDSPAGHAFEETMKPIFLNAYNSVRYEQEKRAQERRDRAKQKSSGDDNIAEEAGEASSGVEESLEGLASRFGKALNEILMDKPEFAPIIDSPAKTSRGQPAKDRIYPVRPTGRSEPFELKETGSHLSIAEKEENQLVKKVVTGNVLRTEAKGSKRRPIGEVVVNTAAGVKLRFVAIGPLDDPYRWDLDNVDDLTLAINVEHSLYRAVVADARPGSAPHRLLCAWVVALALAERSHPLAGPGFAADLEMVSYELFRAWSLRR